MTNTLMCLSLLIFHESRSEPIKGKIAVMEVVMNRTEDSRFPKTPCEVIKQKSQFSWTSNPNNLKPPKYEYEAWEQSQKVATDYLSKRNAGKCSNITKGALYFNTKKMGIRYKVTTDDKKSKVIGNHVFF